MAPNNPETNPDYPPVFSDIPIHPEAVAGELHQEAEIWHGLLQENEDAVLQELSGNKIELAGNLQHILKSQRERNPEAEIGLSIVNLQLQGMANAVTDPRALLKLKKLRDLASVTCMVAAHRAAQQYYPIRKGAPDHAGMARQKMETAELPAGAKQILETLLA
jgi:hypothetical protein